MVPDAASSNSGKAIFDAIPDYVVTLGPEGEPVGYVAKDYLFVNEAGDNLHLIEAERLPVVDENLELVGFMHDNVGFVSLEEDP